jgi:hypothetical protein
MTTSLLGGMLMVGITIVGILMMIAPHLASTVAKRVAIGFGVLVIANTLIAGVGGDGIWRTLCGLAGLVSSIGAVLYMFDPARGGAIWRKVAGFFVAVIVLRISLAMLWSSALGKLFVLAAVCVGLIVMFRHSAEN